MADNNIDLTATFDTSKATSSIKEFGSAAAKSIEGLDDSFYKINNQIDKTSKNKLDLDTSKATSSLDGLKTSLLAVGTTVAAYFTVNAVTSFFSTIVRESMDAEKNLNQLAGAMQRTGQYTAENVKSMDDFATAMAKASTVDDDVINGQLALALNFTKSTEKAQQLVKAAMDLSAATGISLDAAVEQLGKTLDGTAGRLNETVPALRGVSAEALKAGEGIKIVGASFEGAAKNQLSIFDGAVLAAQNSLTNLQSTMGSFITKNPMLIQAINEINASFFAASDAINDNSKSINNFVNNGIVSLITGIRSLLPQLNAFSSFLKAIGTIFEILVKGIMTFVDTLKLLGNAWLWLVGTMEGKKKAFSSMEDIIASINKRADELSASLAGIGKNAFSDKDLKGLEDALARIQDAANKKPIEIGANVKEPAKIEIPTIEPKLEIPDLKKQLEEKVGDFFPFKTQEEMDKAAFLNQFTNWGRLWEKELWPGALDGFTAVTLMIGEGLWNVASYIKKNLPDITKSIMDNLKGIVTAMGEGAEGARKVIPQVLADAVQGIGGLVGSFWGPMGSAIGSGIGGIIGEQIKLASGNLKDTLAKIDEFATEVPNVIDRIVKNLPEILTKINEKLPDIILAILNAIPPIMRAVAKSQKALGKELGKEFVPIIGALLEAAAEGIISGVMTIVNLFDGFIGGLWNWFWEKFAAAVEKVFGEGPKASVTEFKDKILGGLKDLRDGIVDGLKSLSMKSLQDGINTGLEKLGTNITGVLGKIWNNLNDFIKLFAELPAMLWNAIVYVWDFIVSIPATLWNAIMYVWDFFVSIPGLLWDAVMYVWDFFATIPNLLWDAIMYVWDFFVSIPKMLYDAISGIFDIKVGDGGGGLISGTGTILDKLATGGVVPSGYPNDSYPALLTSGETVVRAKSADNLFDVIDSLANGGNVGSQSMDETNALLRQLIALIASQETQVDVKLDRNTLAKAILTLNQDNRRLA